MKGVCGAQVALVEVGRADVAECVRLAEAVIDLLAEGSDAAGQREFARAMMRSTIAMASRIDSPRGQRRPRRIRVPRRM